jgi:hypothetical protein
MQKQPAGAAHHRIVFLPGAWQARLSSNTINFAGITTRCTVELQVEHHWGMCLCTAQPLLAVDMPVATSRLLSFAAGC